MSNQLLFTPYRMGDLDLPNRIVMAPLTRMRAQSLQFRHGYLSAALFALYQGVDAPGTRSVKSTHQ